jgi:prevent-host-death family protein
MIDTVSARELQRNFTKILTKVRKADHPIIVMTNNQPELALINLDLLAQFENQKNGGKISSSAQTLRALAKQILETIPEEK